VNIPFPINIIEADAICCQTLHMTLPSPIEPNTATEVHVEFQTRPDGQIYLEFWGELPRTLQFNLPKTMAQFATGYVTYPGDLNAKESHNVFIEKLIRAISESQTFHSGMARMFSLHRALLNDDVECDEDGNYDDDLFEEE
jgi:hypothetical protein